MDTVVIQYWNLELNFITAIKILTDFKYNSTRIHETKMVFPINLYYVDVINKAFKKNQF